MAAGVGSGKSSQTSTGIVKPDFSFAIRDANENGIYDQPDMSAASASYSNGTVPDNAKIAADILSSGAQIVLFGEVHEFAPTQLIIETVRQARQSGKQPVIALEWPDNLAASALADLKSGKIDAAAFRKQFVDDVYASSFDEMKDKAFLQDMADYIVQLSQAGADVAFIDHRPPNMKGDDITAGLARDRAMADAVKRLALASPKHLVIARVGASHSQTQEPKRLGALLKNELPKEQVLALRFSPIVRTERKSPELIDFWAIISKPRFTNWDYILPFWK